MSSWCRINCIARRYSLRTQWLFYMSHLNCIRERTSRSNSSTIGWLAWLVKWTRLSTQLTPSTCQQLSRKFLSSSSLLKCLSLAIWCLWVCSTEGTSLKTFEVGATPTNNLKANAKVKVDRTQNLNQASGRILRCSLARREPVWGKSRAFTRSNKCKTH